MRSKVGLEGAIRFTKWAVFLACTWPPSRKATKCEFVKRDFILCLSILHILCLFILLINSIATYVTDPVVLTEIATLCSVCVVYIWKAIISRLHRKQFQILITDMEEFSRSCCKEERHIIQGYIDNCWIFHLMISCLFYYAATALIVIFFVNSEQKMIVTVAYPFSTESNVPYHLVLLHQTIFVYQISATCTVDCQVAIILWFAGARLEILAEETKCFSNISQIVLFIKKHNQLLSYANSIAKIMPYVTFVTTGTCGVAAIGVSIQIVADPSLSVIMHFGPALIALLLNLTISIWPAENMMRVCDLVGEAAYNVRWPDMSPKMMKYVLIILQRSQRPVQVSFGGFLPPLSFRFYSSFLTTIFSYFTTLRLAMSVGIESSH
ncbi:putative odorant receptor 92a [Venturia canescens]|uniref:putative odorant receptor 92a n=1 Tax=Venturia canescens TaxID=32260 RepID=UPI001C9BFC07|nr:putative odorant receptor 92a [Venturia canescens]